MSQPILHVSTTSQFKKVMDAKEYPGSFWQPVPGEGYFNLGYYSQKSSKTPNTSVLTAAVENDDPEDPVLVEPVDFNKVYGYHGFWGSDGESVSYTAYAPVAPANYVSMGMIATSGNLSTDMVRCVRQDFAETGQISGQLWHQDKDIYVWGVEISELFIATTKSDEPTQAFLPLGTLDQARSKRTLGRWSVTGRTRRKSAKV